MNSSIYKILIIFLFPFIAIYSQSRHISGVISDSNGTPLLGANIIVQGTLIGTASNAKGEFVIERLKPASYIIEVSLIGYSKFISEKIDLTESNAGVNIVLTPTIFTYDQVIVTGSKRKEDLSNLPVSASAIGGERFVQKNFVNLDDALRLAPGVNFTLDQVSIRGSSGYSRGAGTRVFVAIDGIPIYPGDSGEIIWGIIPVTEIKRVEIIKGASSTLYGSSAIGGVINVISKELPSGPVTYLRTYYGIYDNPSHDIWKWSDKRRGFNGITLSHSNNFGGLGLSISLSRMEDMGYKQGDWRKRYLGYLKAKYYFSKNSSLTLLGSGYFQDKGTFLYWKDSRNALVPPDADQGQRVPSQRFVLGAEFDQIISGAFSFSLKSNLFRSIWRDDSESKNNSNSSIYRTELQLIFKSAEPLLLTGGAEASMGKVNSNIFGAPGSQSLGSYLQAEYKFNFPLILTGGIRYDISKLDSLDKMNSVSPKIGLNYKISSTSILRAYFGKGFRAPTLAEAFTSTTTSGVTVKQNLKLKPETNYSIEFGVNQKLGGQVEFDAAIFQNEFFNLIEPRIDSDLKVIFDNVTHAKILGCEISAGIDLPRIYTKINAGYTYLWARDADNKKALKYRPRHTIDLQADLNFKNFSFGADFRYWSKVEEIDWELIDLGIVPDGERMTDAVILDFRAGYNFYSLRFPMKAFLNLNNILNYNYAEMIGNISPLRNISLNLEFVF